jgi:uncharacterized protein
MKFTTADGPFAICRLDPKAGLPGWATKGGLSSITRTPDELSIICEQAAVPRDVKAERGFRCVQLVGPFDFQAIGILESFLRPLAEAAVPVFAISTYDTDWILIQEPHWDRALLALARAGHERISPR